jgi:hypothetical protein
LTDSEASHAQLRLALILAGTEIRRLNFGRRSSPILVKLRGVLNNARIAAKVERGKVKLKLAERLVTIRSMSFWISRQRIV